LCGLLLFIFLKWQVDIMCFIKLFMAQMGKNNLQELVHTSHVWWNIWFNSLPSDVYSCFGDLCNYYCLEGSKGRGKEGIRVQI